MDLIGMPVMATISSFSIPCCRICISRCSDRGRRQMACSIICLCSSAIKCAFVDSLLCNSSVFLLRDTEVRSFCFRHLLTQRFFVAIIARLLTCSFRSFRFIHSFMRTSCMVSSASSLSWKKLKATLYKIGLNSRIRFSKFSVVIQLEYARKLNCQVEKVVFLLKI